MHGLAMCCYLRFNRLSNMAARGRISLRLAEIFNDLLLRYYMEDGIENCHDWSLQAANQVLLLVEVTFWLSSLGLLVLLLSIYNYLAYQSCALNLISTILLLSLGRYLCWWNISPRGYRLPWSQCFSTDMVIRYIYYWNLQFLNKVLINQN
jgi:hypothetical protein